ncbi:hypothetical protein V7128_17730 [Neobacillus vireti]|uniref:hypothetical protein n=1 Tax=Neobacillus vireti TaxID=220686 RepID=UPI002FFFE0C9
MTNKNILQLISGALMFLSFFSAWYYNGGFTYLKPAEFISAEGFNEPPPLVFKLFLLLPVLGVVNAYYGIIKKYHYILSIGSSIICLLLCVSMWRYVEKFHDQVSSGFYMAGLALLVSAASIFIMKKEIKEKNISSNG